MRLEKVGSEPAGCGGPASTELHTDQSFTERTNVNKYALLKGILAICRLDVNQNGERTLLQEAMRRMIMS